jgi:hypothetical protein
MIVTSGEIRSCIYRILICSLKVASIKISCCLYTLSVDYCLSVDTSLLTFVATHVTIVATHVTTVATHVTTVATHVTTVANQVTI